MTMQITVFGASGNVGRIVVQKLLADGHTVTVFVHQSNAFEPSDQLKIIKGDIHNAALVASAVQGSDAIISTLGSWHTPTKDILSAMVRFVTPVMEQSGIKRLITLTGSGAWAPGDKIGFINKLSHAAFALVAKDIIRDAETHLQLLAASNLEWTSLRAPIMSSGKSSKYSLNNKLPLGWERVSREAVAQAIVDQLTDRNYVRQAPHIHQA